MEEYLAMSPFDHFIPMRQLYKLFCNTHENGCRCGYFRCGSKDIEFLAKLQVIEGPKDEHYTSLGPIGPYLSSKPRDVCVANVGLHEGAKEVTTLEYTNAVETYLSLLQPHCKSIIWISTSAVKGDPKYRQNNACIQEWNQSVKRMIVTKFPNIAYIDMYPMSTVLEMHVDNVHLSGVYYKKAASFFDVPL